MSEELFQTPVLFLIFNRKDTAQQVFDQIKKVKPAKLYVSADGPRTNKPGEDLLCQETRDIIKQVDWDCELHTRFLNENLGCGQAISSAITWMFETEKTGIILEDDCVPDVTFFPYCEMMLERYRDEPNVMLVTGDNPIEKIEINESYYFSRCTSCWGWATWKRAWNKFDMKIKDWNLKRPNFLKDKYFDCVTEYKEELIYNYDKIYAKTDPSTWAISWSCNVILNQGLCIIPKENLISNIGDYGVHFSGTTNRLHKKVNNFNTENIIHPKTTNPNRELDCIRIRYSLENSKKYLVALQISAILRKYNLLSKSTTMHPITIGLKLKEAHLKIKQLIR